MGIYPAKALVTLLAAGCLTMLAIAHNAPPAGASAAKGLIDARIETLAPDSQQTATIITEMRRGLNVKWVRLIVDWATLEPAKGTYDAAEVQRLETLVSGLHAAGIRVILTTWHAPAWAQDQSLWKNPPPGFTEGPQAFYAVRRGALDDLERLGRFLATHFRGRAQALEFWNEPNLWVYLYPQRTRSDVDYGPRTYLRMLRAFHAGVRMSGQQMKVIAGATGPIGLNDVYRTSPQRFARFLRRAHAGRWFDAYSHHPYTPGGSVYPGPGQPPNDPSTTVTLANLSTLLRLFPHKPFYLTEYGYNTKPTLAFGGFAVSEAKQARYLRSAYRLVRAHPQVRALIWYLLRDAEPPSGEGEGVYSGLRRLDGTRKPAWYAFKRM